MVEELQSVNGSTWPAALEPGRPQNDREVEMEHLEQAVLLQLLFFLYV